jgi:negative regulator of genetic competence, sporulation and motility
MFETPTRPQSTATVPDAPVRIRKEPDPSPADQEDELPQSEDEAEDQEEDEAEEEAEDQEEDEDEAEEEVDDNKDQEDLLSKIVVFLKAPNTIPIAVLVGWTAYLTVQNYCSCP